MIPFICKQQRCVWPLYHDCLAVSAERVHEQLGEDRFTIRYLSVVLAVCR